MLRKLVLFMAVSLTLAGTVHAGRDTITQISTIDALMTGVYDGETTLSDLKEKGDFGLGTFNTLDGEMILLDGKFYRAAASGAVERPGFHAKTPFAAVTFFDPDRRMSIEGGLDFRGTTAQADKMLPTVNIFYAVKITGSFQMVRVRSVPAQQKPYRPLNDVVKTQPVYELKNVRGTIVGFRCPPFAKGINVPGYHMHFLTSDRKAGGHVLDFRVEQALLEIDDSSEFTLVLPSDKAFYGADLTPDREKELRAVEK